MVQPVLRPDLTAFIALCCLAAPVARAGEAPCWYDNRVLVVSASVMGVAGDYILDTGAARTELAETQAQTAGLAGAALHGPVEIGGVRIAGRAITVADLDVRTGLFPTPIAGVIGADVLAAYVLDVRLEPCQVALHLARQVPRLRGGEVLPLRRAAGPPVVQAAVSDGLRAWRGDFVVATGMDRAIRIVDDAASAPGARRPGEVYPYGVAVPRLRAASLAGQLYENIEAGLLKTSPQSSDGAVGPAMLERYTLRFDFPGARLRLIPNEKGPPETGGP